ncbi:SET domain-containing protein [Cryptosporidium canis]|uniref:SET domain-containing protein n=1 Tax=Cryptosporidium canis TaxID=195482 RepID=A0A9D5HW44_9CRYT|nr:SET domain-containing protein [Cryptosporidium canis]
MDCYSREECRVDGMYHLILSEIDSLSENERYIDVFYSEARGKHIHSNRFIPNGTNILQEVPYVSWPIRTSFGELENLEFCENCLKIKNPENDEFLSLDALGLERRICSKICFKKISGVNFDEYDPGSPTIRGGWGYYINGANGIEALRKYQLSVDHLREIPITAEAISRCIAQMAADIYFYWHEFGMNSESLYHAFKLGTKSIENFVAPPATIFPEIDFKPLIQCIKGVIFKQLADSFPESFIVDSLLSKMTIEQLVGQLTLNSQGLNIWDTNYSLKNGDDFSDDIHRIRVLKGACICVIQSCFNHSCDPSCHIHTIDDSTVYVIANRDIESEEELTISYIDNTLPLKDRRSLIQNYHFTCGCKLCKMEDRSSHSTPEKKKKLE